MRVACNRLLGVPVSKNFMNPLFDDAPWVVFAVSGCYKKTITCGLSVLAERLLVRCLVAVPDEWTKNLYCQSNLFQSVAQVSVNNRIIWKYLFRSIGIKLYERWCKGSA